MPPKQHRFVTRADFDGLVCAVMLGELDQIDEVVFVHPQDVRDGTFEITGRDITANLPYVAAAHRAFEYGSHARVRNTSHLGNHVIDPLAPSAARMIWLDYGGPFALPNISDAMLRAVDQSCSASYKIEEVLHPKGWTLLNFIMDARTGLGRFRKFRISNYQLMLSLIESIRALPVERILELPDVRERVDLYFEHEGPAVDQLLASATVQGNVVVLDVCEQNPIWATNRFMVYALYPQCNLVIRKMWGRDRSNIVYALGKSIFEPTCASNVGELCRRFGGSGHTSAGSIQVEESMADKVLGELIALAQRDEDTRLAALRPRRRR